MEEGLVMKIVKIFHSVQGEGANMGVPCTFIRFAHCNLHCPFCDTFFDFIDPTLVFKTHEELEKLCKHELVVLTGGEPTLQEDLIPFIQYLKSKNHKVAVESNGTYEDYSKLDCWVTVSPKYEYMYGFVPSGVSELKYVVPEQFEDGVAIPESVRRKFKGRIWLQPCDLGSTESIKKAWKKCYEIAMKDDRLRVGVQLHKFMEVE